MMDEQPESAIVPVKPGKVPRRTRWREELATPRETLPVDTADTGNPKRDVYTRRQRVAALARAPAFVSLAYHVYAA